MENGMQQRYSMKLRQIVKEQSMEVVFASSDYENVEITSFNVARPTLQLVGFYNYFDPARLRLWGKTETAFLATLEPERREQVIDALFARKIPAMILCNGTAAEPEILAAARKHDITLLSTEEDTSEIVARLSDTLRYELSPRLTVHGVLVNVFGEGLLMIGDSGIGKSEVALELVKRGHHLVADDAVELRRAGRDALDGSAPRMIRYLMEMRGVGLIDVRRIFGMGAVMPRSKVNLVVELKHWQEDIEYDRLGLEDEYTEYLGVTRPKLTIPVAPGRNLATILEVAAMNHRQRKLGYNTAREFLKRYDSSIDAGNEDLFTADDPYLS